MTNFDDDDDDFTSRILEEIKKRLQRRARGRAEVKR